MDKKEVYMSCDCGCGIMKFTKYEEDSIGIEYYASSFYEKQYGVFNKLLHRIKIAWFMLIGKEFLLYDILVDIDSKKVKEMAEFFEDIGNKEDEK